MAFIDYGALLKVDDKFVNKNTDLFMECSNTGYKLEKALYRYDGEEHEIDISGNFYVYAGDENLLLAFYKGYFYVISNGRVIRSVSYVPFLSETFYIDVNDIGSVEIKVSHLDKEYKYDKDPVESWPDYVREHWVGATGSEKLSDLEGGRKYYRNFQRYVKKMRRYKGYKYLTGRWIAEWNYNGHHYEVIFGHGVDSNEDVWESIKDKYDFSETEVKLIDRWFEGKE